MDIQSSTNRTVNAATDARSNLHTPSAADIDRRHAGGGRLEDENVQVVILHHRAPVRAGVARVQSLPDL